MKRVFEMCWLLVVLIAAAGCRDGAESNGEDPNAGGNATSTEGDSAETVTPGLLRYSSLNCDYIESYGAFDDLELNLQFSGDQQPSETWFQARLNHVEPATPATLGAAGIIDFEFSVGFDFGKEIYFGELENGEITIELDSLPDPATLQDHQAVILEGTLRISAFTLPESVLTGGKRNLALQAQEIPIRCTANFRRGQVVN